MRATLQLEVLKGLLKDQYGVPSGVVDQLDNLYRLTYKEGWSDKEAELKDRLQEQREGEGL